MRKLILLFTVIVVSLNIISQEDLKFTYQTEDGVVNYLKCFSDTTVSEIQSFKPSESSTWIGSNLSKKEAFHHGIDLSLYKTLDKGSILKKVPSISDNAFSMLSKEVKRDQYFYDANGDIDYVVRNGHLDSAIYFYGKDIEVSSIKSEYVIDGRVGEIVKIETEVYNHTDKRMFFENSMKTLSFSPLEDDRCLMPRSINKLVFHIIPSAGFNKDTLILFNKDFNIKYPIKCFGYELCTDDVLMGIPLTIASNFHFKRIGKESLLTIYDVNQEKVIIRVPLTNEKMEINLSEIGKGEFILSLHDFRDNKKSLCNVEIE